MSPVTLKAAAPPHVFNLLFLIPLFPFVGAAINGILGKKIQDRFGKSAIHGVAITAMALSALVALYAFIGHLVPLPPDERALLNHVFPMIRVGHARVEMAFLMDQLSGIMTLIITLVGTLIHVYSTGYMAEEPSYWRFFAYLNLFVFSMLLLVLGDNFIVMFFGWEGVGLCSYLLIGFWYKEKKNASAGMKAFVVNRVGDWGFIVGLFLLFWGLGGTWAAASYMPEVTNPDAGTVASATQADSATAESFVIAQPVAEESHSKGEHAAGEEAHGEGEHAEKAAGEPHGSPRPVLIGPTVTFRELREQLSLFDQEGHRVLLEGGALPVQVKPLRASATAQREALATAVPVHFEGLLSRRVWGIPLLFLACLCFFVGATGKSAQLPLYVWLPDAMAGPTPVSALIHAATMVTAGVYMIARLNFLFVLSPGAMTVIAVVGAATALFAATIGLFQYDIKKVLAYSTVSQLGFMFIGVGVGAYWAGVFHLMTHAFFKACLFLGAGSVIHGMHHLTHHREHEAHHGAHGHDAEGAHALGGDALSHDEHGDDTRAHDTHAHDTHAVVTHDHDTHKPRDLRLEADPFDPQDMRNMGGLASRMPLTRLSYLIACWAIAGFPWAAGFYSKDEILWKAFSNGSTLVPGPVIWLIGLVAATCTSFYMFRSYYMTFYYRAPSEEHKAHVHESPRNITWVLLTLAAACLIAGPVLGLPSLWTGGRFEPVLERWLEPVTELSGWTLTGARAWHENHGLEAAFMLLSIGVATAGWAAARALYFDAARGEARLSAWKASWNGLHRIVYNKYYVDEIYGATVVASFKIATRIAAWFDRAIIDGIVNLLGHITVLFARIDGAIDKYVVDGAVNLVADAVLVSGRQARRVQTGRINNYVLVATAGVVVIVLIVAFLV